MGFLYGHDQIRVTVSVWLVVCRNGIMLVMFVGTENRVVTVTQRQHEPDILTSLDLGEIIRHKTYSST